jgi:hypothetical protein
VEFERAQRLEERGATPVFLQSLEAGTLRKVCEFVQLPAAL